MFHYLKKSKVDAPKIDETSELATVYSEDVEDELRAKNLNHFVSRNVCSSNELVFTVYENERWHPILKSWGSVGGVHLSDVFDRRHLTDETGNKALCGSLSEVKPITGYKWRDETSGWTVVVDSLSTDPQGYQYAHHWQSLHDEYIPWITSNALALVRRRKWRRVMVVDTSTPVRTLPYELILKIKRADLHVSGSSSHCFVETYLDGILYDTTLSTACDWNKTVNIKLMYLKPTLTISFLLYMKRSLPPLLAKLSVLSHITSSANSVNSASGDSYCIGASHVDLTIFMTRLNMSPQDTTYELLARETGKCTAHLTVSAELSETKLFQIVSAQTAVFKQLRVITQSALRSELTNKISLLDNRRYSLLNNVSKLLIEHSSLLYECDLLTAVNDLIVLNSRCASDPAGGCNMIGILECMRNIQLTQQALSYYPRIAYRYTSVIQMNNNGNTQHNQHNKHNTNNNTSNNKLLQLTDTDLHRINHETYIHTHPINSSIYDLNNTAGYPFTSQHGYDISIVTMDGVEHALRIANHKDYILILKELSHAKYSSVYDYCTSGRSGASIFTVSAVYTLIDSTDNSNNNTQSNTIQSTPVTITIDNSETAQCVFIDGQTDKQQQRGNNSTSFTSINNTTPTEEVQLLIPFEDIQKVLLRSVPVLVKNKLVEVTLLSASSSHLTHTHTTCRVDIETSDGITQLHTAPPNNSNRHSVTDQDITTLIFREEVFRFLVSEFDSHLAVTFHTNATTVNTNNNNHRKQQQTVIPLVSSHSLLPIPQTNTNTTADHSLFFFNGVTPYTLKLNLQKMEHLLAVDSSTNTSDPYFIVYLADSHGQIIPLNGGSNINNNTTATSAINNTMRSVASLVTNSTNSSEQYIYKSRVISKCTSPSFNDIISIPSDKHQIALSYAKHLYIEIFDRNTTRSDVPLGEIYIPLVQSVDVALNKKTNYKQYAVQPSKNMMTSSSVKYMNKTNVDSLGVVFAELTIQYGNNTNNNTKSNTQQQDNSTTQGDNDVILMRTKVTAKPLQVEDCYWPANILRDTPNNNKSNTGGVEVVTPPDTYHILLGHDGLHLYSANTMVNNNKHHNNTSSTTSSPPLLSDFNRMLTECREYVMTDSNTHNICLVIPYNQISLTHLAILTLESVHLVMQLKRLLVDDKKRSAFIVERTVDITLTITPCQAENMYVSITNHIAMHDTRFSLHTLLTSSVVTEVCSEQYNTLVTQLQGDLYRINSDIQTVARHIQHNKLIMSEDKITNDNTTDTAITTQNTTTAAAPFSHYNTTYNTTESTSTSTSTSSVACGYGDLLLLRILTLRKATTQLYFWFAFDRVAARYSLTNAYIPHNINNNTNTTDQKQVVTSNRTKYTLDYIKSLTSSLDKYLNGDNNNSNKSTHNSKHNTSNSGADNNALDASLVSKVTYSMSLLNTHVRDCVLENCTRPSSQEVSNADIRALLTRLIYDQYLVVVNYVTRILVDEQQSLLIPARRTSLLKEEEKEGEAQREIAHQNAKIQRKRDLISFIVTQDSLFVDNLLPALQSFCYQFDVPPLLSIVVDFNDLIDRFSSLLEENIQMWNSKTLSHFMTHRTANGDDTNNNNTIDEDNNNSNNTPSRGTAMNKTDSSRRGSSNKPSDFSQIPWDVSTLSVLTPGPSSTNPVEKEYYISHIPETIQTQLNIQIGLKKIPLNNNNTQIGATTSLSLQSIRRIYAINAQISLAVAKAYVSLAVEYEMFITKLTVNRKESNSNGLGIGRGGLVHSSSLFLRTLGSNILQSNLLNNITSGGNTPLSSPGAADSESNNSTDSDSQNDDLCCWLMSCVNDAYRVVHSHVPDSIAAFTSDYTSDDEEEEDDTNTNNNNKNSRVKPSKGSKKQQIASLYTNSLRAMDCVAKHALNCLANEILFAPDLRSYFLSEFDQYVLSSGNMTDSNGRNRPFVLSLPLLSLVSKIYDKTTSVLTTTATIGNNNNNTTVKGGGGSDGLLDQVETNTNTTAAPVYSPIEVICATLTAFIDYASQHMYHSDLNRLIYTCLKKLCLRYLICLRDVTARLEHSRRGLLTVGGGAVGKLLFNNLIVTGTTAVITTGFSGLNTVAGGMQTGLTGLTEGINTGINNINDLMALNNNKSRLSITDSTPNNNKLDEPDSDDDDYVDRVNKNIEGTTQSVSHKSIVSSYDFDHPYLSETQCMLIKADLNVISNAYMHVQHEKTLTLLRFLNTEVVNILCGGAGDVTTSQPAVSGTFKRENDTDLNSTNNGLANDINRIILGQFNLVPPVYRTSYLNNTEHTTSYEKEVEDCVSLSAAFNDRLPREIADHSQRAHTLQFSDLQLVNMNDFKLIAVRISIDNTSSSSIAPRESAPMSHIHKSPHWNDVMRFRDVTAYETRTITLQVVEKRPLGILSEYIHGTVTIKLSDVLTQFVSQHTRSRAFTANTDIDDEQAVGVNTTRSLVGWYALDMTNDSNKTGLTTPTRSRKNSTATHRMINTQQQTPRESEGPHLRVRIVISDVIE